VLHSQPHFDGKKLDNDAYKLLIFTLKTFIGNSKQILSNEKETSLTLLPTLYIKNTHLSKIDISNLSTILMIQKNNN